MAARKDELMKFKHLPYWSSLFNWLSEKMRSLKPKRKYTKRSDCWLDMKAHRAAIKAKRMKAAMELATYGGLPQGSAVEMPVEYKY